MPIKLIPLIFLYLCAREDCRTRAISAGWFVLFGGIGILCLFGFPAVSWQERLPGAGVGCVILLAAARKKSQIGAGDGWLFLVSGIYLGLRLTMTMLFLSTVLCALFCLICLLTRQKKWRDRVAFAPFVLAAYVLILCFDT